MKKTVTHSVSQRVRQSSKRPFTLHIDNWSNKQSPSQANYYFLIQTNSLTEQSFNQPIKLTNRSSSLTLSISLFSLIPIHCFITSSYPFPHFSFILYHIFSLIPYIIFHIFPHRISSLIFPNLIFPPNSFSSIHFGCIQYL